MQRPRRNPEDQNVQPSLHHFAGENQQGDVDDHEDINLIVGASQSSCLTLREYEDQLMINIFSDEEDGDIYLQNEKKQCKNQNKHYDMRPQLAIRKSQQKQD